MKTAGAILRLRSGRGSAATTLPVFLSYLIILLIQGEEREISGKIGVQFVYFNIDYSTKYFIGFLDSRGRIFPKSKDIPLWDWELIFLKRFLSLPKTTVKSLEWLFFAKKPS